MTSTIGTAVFTNHVTGDSITLEAGFQAAVKIHSVKNQDILVWIEGAARSRIGLSEIFYLLQKSHNVVINPEVEDDARKEMSEQESLTQEQIWNLFFEDFSLFEDGTYMEKLTRTMAIVCGTKYQEQVAVEAQASEKEAKAKKTPTPKK